MLPSLKDTGSTPRVGTSTLHQKCLCLWTTTISWTTISASLLKSLLRTQLNVPEMFWNTTFGSSMTPSKRSYMQLTSIWADLQGFPTTEWFNTQCGQHGQDIPEKSIRIACGLSLMKSRTLGSPMPNLKLMTFGRFATDPWLLMRGNCQIWDSSWKISKASDLESQFGYIPSSIMIANRGTLMRWLKGKF